MSDSNLHLPYDVPTLVVGGAAFGITGNRHVRYPKGTRLTNLHLALLEKMGVRAESLGDSTRHLSLDSA